MWCVGKIHTTYFFEKIKAKYPYCIVHKKYKHIKRCWFKI